MGRRRNFSPGRGEGVAEELSWKVAFGRAALFEAVLLAIIFVLFSGVVPGFHGVHNPLSYLVAAVLQFPASLLMPLVSSISAGQGYVETLYISVLLVVTTQTLMIASLIRLIAR